MTDDELREEMRAHDIDDSKRAEGVIGAACLALIMLIVIMLTILSRGGA